MAKEFSLERIKSILEYNLRENRVKGMEYIDDLPGNLPNGTSNLKSDASLNSWNSPDIQEIPVSNPRFARRDNNIELRDAIARTIYDILSGSTSTNNFTPNVSSVPTTPTNGNNAKDGLGLYLEVTSGQTATIKSGTSTIVASEASVNISKGTSSAIVSDSSIIITVGSTTFTVTSTGVSVV